MRKLWHDYVWGKQNLKQLATTYHRSTEWVRTHLDTVSIQRTVVPPQPTVFIADTTFFGRTWGVCVFRAPHLRRNIWWTDVTKELMSHYYYGRRILEERGWIFQAVVIDGRRGMIKVFEGMPIQICQFHQMKTVTKYLTKRPETEAGKALRAIMLILPNSTESAFTKLLYDWKQQYAYILTDKTYTLVPDGGTTPIRRPTVHIRV